jgi:TetR/AcrR family transcriptional regulator, transcriptional repressor for nem operon
MPRPREFDEGEVLRKALGVFRARGFDGATLDELERATGLGRGSLYGAFGDKRALFHKALACYRETALDERLAALAGPEAGRAAILRFFRSLAADASCDRERRGCLVTNCSVELADRDPEFAREAARGLDRFERAFAAAVARAQAVGDIEPTRDPVRLARFLTVCMEGMLVLARIRPDAAWLDDAVAVIDEILR